MKLLVILIFLPFTVFSQALTQQEVKKYQAAAAQVTIIRDQWGIAHVYGKTDADAVFGLLYAQCEENFTKMEENNLEVMGRLSEIGKADPYDDLQMRLIYDSSAAIKDYENAPVWFRKLLDAAAGGVNFWLYKHPETHPALLNHFEPWFALMRTNGSISATQNGGITKEDMKHLYKLDEQGASARNSSFRLDSMDEYGSNGFALAPAKTQSRHAILYINPHVTFYYRTEMQMVSEEGLNAYGGVTWGTFFIFQGFNQHCGWMHTSSDADVADLYQEQISKQGDSTQHFTDQAQMYINGEFKDVLFYKEDVIQHAVKTYQPGE